MAICVICDRKTSGPLNFCKIHFNEYKSDIEEKKPWIKLIKNEAQRERRRKERELNDTSLDAILDRTYEDRY